MASERGEDRKAEAVRDRRMAQGGSLQAAHTDSSQQGWRLLRERNPDLEGFDRASGQGFEQATGADGSARAREPSRGEVAWRLDSRTGRPRRSDLPLARGLHQDDQGRPR